MKHRIAEISAAQSAAHDLDVAIERARELLALLETELVDDGALSPPPERNN